MPTLTPQSPSRRHGARCVALLVSLSACERAELLAILESGSAPEDPPVPTAPASTTPGPTSTDAGLGDSDASLPVAPNSADAATPAPDGSASFDAGLATDGAAAADAGPLPPGNPIAAINDPVFRDTDPSFTGDRLELYFVSTRGGSKDIFRSVRTDVAADWGAPELVAELSWEGQDENPFVAEDGLDLWYFTDRDRALGSIWHSTRATRLDAWSTPTPVTALNLAEGGSDVSVTVDASGTRFVLNSKAPGAPPYGLHEFVLDPESGIFAPPATLTEVNGETDDFDPDLREEGLFLAFDSDRGGIRQIYWTRRQSLDTPFAEPVPLTPSAVAEESAVAFAEDLRYLMFSSAAAGSADIYERFLDTPP